MTIHLISFRHSGLSLTGELAPFFLPVKLYVPWGGNVDEYAGNRQMIPSFPPEEYKPDADFDALLNECFNWAYEQGEKSRKEIIKTGHTNPTSNESLRHIKTILAGRLSDTSGKDTILRWHILLHLADRLEENRNDANRMLEDLKKKPSPLLHIADLTENTRYPLENLREISPEFLINDRSIKLLFNAWYGLFNSLVEKGDLLLTFDRRIFEHLSDEWYTLEDGGLKNHDIIPFKSPLFKRTEKYSADYVENITFGDDICNIAVSDMEPSDRVAALKKLAAEFESEHRVEAGENHIHFSILLFQPPENSERIENESLFEFLSGRALIFAEIDA